MNRRHVLRRATIAAASITALAGCSEQKLKEAESQPPRVKDLYNEEEVELPVSQKFEKAESGVLEAEGEEISDPDTFKAYLDEQGVRVETLEEKVEKGEPLLSLEYVEDTSHQGVVPHTGIIAGGYASLVEAGHESEKLEATILDPDQRKFGEFEIDREWAEQYNEGTITAAKYGGLVMDTIESTQ